MNDPFDWVLAAFFVYIILFSVYVIVVEATRKR
jgi:hypothetical protein